jgi:hypothetical protein
MGVSLGANKGVWEVGGEMEAGTQDSTGSSIRTASVSQEASAGRFMTCKWDFMDCGSHSTGLLLRLTNAGA